MSQNSNRKRERATNFSPDESAHLLSVVESNGFLNIVENKKTDAVTTLGKNEAWKKIADTFNAKGLGPPRDVKSLKAKYDTIKRNLRKNDTGWRVTGGGPYVPEPRLTEGEVVLRDRIALSIRGLDPHPSDCDSSFSKGIDEESQVILEDPQDVLLDWEDASASMLQTPVDPALRARNDSPGLITSRPNSPAVAINSTSAAPMPLGNGASTSATTPLPNGDPSRRRPVFKKKKTVSTVAGKFEELADRKIRLVNAKQEIMDLAKKQAEFECRRAEVELRRAEVELEKSKFELRKMMREVSHDDGSQSSQALSVLNDD